MLSFMLDSLYLIWNLDDIERLLVFLIKEQWEEGIKELIESKTLESLIFSEDEKYRNDIF